MAITQRNQKAGQKMKLIHGNLSKRQLGIFGLPKLFKDEAEKKETTATTQTIKSERDLTSTTATKADETGVSKTSLLSPEVQAALESMVLNLAGSDAAGGGGAGGDISGIGDLLLQRATGAADDIRGSTDAIIADERRKGRREIAAISTSIGQDAGGVGVGSNSFVAGATAEGEAALSTGLARLAAELDISARGVETGELVGAADVFGKGAATGATETNQLATLVAQLRGATQVTETAATKTQTQEQQLNEIIDQLTKGTGVTTGTSTESPSLLTLGTKLLAASKG